MDVFTFHSSDNVVKYVTFVQYGGKLIGVLFFILKIIFSGTKLKKYMKFKFPSDGIYYRHI